jgi:CBS domain-containing protein
MNANVTVQDMMDREYVGVSESDDLVETVELLLREDAETAVVQRGSEHVGVLTERDILAALVDGPDPETASVGDVMTSSVPTISPDRRLDVAADKMSTEEAGRLVVTNGSEPLGTITERDLLAARTRELESVPETAGEPPIVAGTAATAEREEDTMGETAGSYQDQSICEGCGTLASDLASFNGQLLCSECRDM